MNRSRWLVIAMVGLCLGCTASRRTVFYQLGQFDKLTSKSLNRLIWENELKPEDDISKKTLLRGDQASYHLVQIRSSEKKHAHEYHDLVVFMQSGYGTMFLGKESFKVTAGSVIFVPHHTWHYFVNEGADPAVALTVFSPAFNGKDIVYP